jgi:hypothetical protein
MLCNSTPCSMIYYVTFARCEWYLNTTERSSSTVSTFLCELNGFRLLGFYAKSCWRKIYFGSYRSKVTPALQESWNRTKLKKSWPLYGSYPEILVSLRNTSFIWIIFDSNSVQCDTCSMISFTRTEPYYKKLRVTQLVKKLISLWDRKVYCSR